MSDRLHKIEQEIETERGLLEGAITQLSAALSSDALASSVSTVMRDKSTDIGNFAVNAARANPAGVVLLGLGAVALLAGPKRPVNRAGVHPVPASPLDTDPLHGGFDRRVAAASADIAAKHEPRAGKMRAAVDAGLANLPEPARRKIVAARHAAIEVQENLDRQAMEAARQARRFHYAQPLASAAVAAGVGAVVAALLPRTRMEDSTLGAKRDALLEQAEFALRDELAKLSE